MASPTEQSITAARERILPNIEAEVGTAEGNDHTVNIVIAGEDMTTGENGKDKNGEQGELDRDRTASTMGNQCGSILNMDSVEASGKKSVTLVASSIGNNDITQPESFRLCTQELSDMNDPEHLSGSPADSTRVKDVENENAKDDMVVLDNTESERKTVVQAEDITDPLKPTDCHDVNANKVPDVHGEHQDIGNSEKSTIPKSNPCIKLKRLASVLSTVDFSACDTETCVRMIRIPSIKIYTALNKKLKQGDQVWIQGFLEDEGLSTLLDTVDTISSKRVQLSEALMLLECIDCVKSVLNSKIGLEYIIENKECLKKLTKALDTSNVSVKNQVFRLLSALTMYSQEGLQMTLVSLDSYKVNKKQRYRFSLLVNELRRHGDMPQYLATVLGFINCLIEAHDDLDIRVAIRNEFVGLNVLDILDQLRDTIDEDLIIQLDNFDEGKDADEELLNEASPHGLDLTSHLQVFNAIFQKVCNSPHAQHLLSILQSLLQIDEHYQTSDLIWSVLEDFTRKCVQCSSQQDIDRLLGVDKQIGIKPPRLDLNRTLDYDEEFQTPPTSPGKYVMETTAITTTHLSYSGPPPLPGVSGPPPPPPLPGVSGPPPPPPLPGVSGLSPPPPLPGVSGLPPLPPLPGVSGLPPPPPLPGVSEPPPPPPLPGMCGPPPPPPLPGMCGPPPPPPIPGMSGPPPPPPPLPGMSGPPPPPPPIPGVGGPPPPPPMSAFGLSIAPVIGMTFHMSQQLTARGIQTPRPSKKMKTLNWTKVSAKEISEKSDNIWKDILLMPDPLRIDYSEVEGLFAQKQVNLEQKLEDEAPIKKTAEICLLDSKASMKINIFLRQFKGTNDEIVRIIGAGDENQIGIERLKGLLGIMPNKEEIELMQSYDGDKALLGNAEKFYVSLLNLPGYKIRVEGMILKSEFQIDFNRIHPNLELLNKLSSSIGENESLKEFLRFTLHTGNFINAGGYAGNALGFKINSLMKLSETKSSKPRFTLLHYMVDEAEQRNSHVLEFVKDLEEPLKIASRLSVDALTAEVNELSERVDNLKNQLKSHKDIKGQFKNFIKACLENINILKRDLEKLEKHKNHLAQQFCEQEKMFKLEDFHSTFSTFCERIKQCQKDNAQRKIQQDRAEKRKKEQQEVKLKKVASVETALPVENDCIIDKLMDEIRTGKTLRRTRTVRNAATSNTTSQSKSSSTTTRTQQ